jgi:hypothetical protein
MRGGGGVRNEDGAFVEHTMRAPTQYARSLNGIFYIYMPVCNQPVCEYRHSCAIACRCRRTAERWTGRGPPRVPTPLIPAKAQSRTRKNILTNNKRKQRMVSYQCGRLGTVTITADSTSNSPRLIHSKRAHQTSATNQGSPQSALVHGDAVGNK